MSSQAKIHIYDIHARDVAEAILHSDFAASDMRDVGVAWKRELDRYMADAKQRRLAPSLWPQYAHWRWDTKSIEAPEARRFAIECQGDIQGMMVVLVGSSRHLTRLKEQVGQETVYVDYLLTAPWNLSSFLPLIGERARFKGVGPELIGAAIDLSLDQGYNGHICLHALPQAERFYGDACRMVTQGPDWGYQDLRYFEMPVAQAKLFRGVTS